MAVVSLSTHQGVHPWATRIRFAEIRNHTYAVQKCTSLKDDSTFEVKISVRVQQNDTVYIFVYNKHQMYIPSLSKIYGSDFRKLIKVYMYHVVISIASGENHLLPNAYLQPRHQNSNYGHYQYYDIHQTNKVRLNMPNKPCLDNDKSLRECIESYVDSQLGCHIPWYAVHSDLQACETEGQFQDYARLSSELDEMDARGMHLATGCVPPCRESEYRMQEVAPIGVKTHYPPDLLKIRFMYTTGEEEG